MLLSGSFFFRKIHIIFLQLSLFGCASNEVSIPSAVIQEDSLSPTKSEPSIEVISAKNLGAGSYDDFSSLLATPDSGFLLVGSTIQSQNKFPDEGPLASVYARVVKLNAQSEITWTNIWDDKGANRGEAAALVPGGGYIVAGNAIKEADLGYEPWLAKYDNAGNILWKKLVDSSGTCMVNAVAVDGKGNIIVSGLSSLSREPGEGDENGWILKLTPDGIPFWSFIFNNNDSNECFESVLPVNEDQILPGYTTEERKGLSRRGVIVTRVGPEGNTLWTFYFNKIQNVLYKAFAPSLKDSSLVIAIATPPDRYPSSKKINTKDDPCILKLKMNGEVAWSRTLAGPNDDEPHAITITREGEIVVAGLAAKMDEHTGDEPEDENYCWLTKLDPGGKKISSSVLCNSHYGDYISGICTINDGKLAIAGMGVTTGKNLTGKLGCWLITVKYKNTAN